MEGNFLKLERSTYGFVQAAQLWWKKCTTVLKDNLGFEQCEDDSCLLKRSTKVGKAYLIVYVDNYFAIGDKNAVKQALDEIENHFSITRSKNIEDFIGYHIEKDGKKKSFDRDLDHCCIHSNIHVRNNPTVRENYPK